MVEWLRFSKLPNSSFYEWKKKFELNIDPDAQIKKEIKSYIHWYNEDRIKTKLSGLSPVEYRRQTA